MLFLYISALNEKILQVLYEVREQNSQILNILQKKAAEPTRGEIPELPVQLPLNQMVDLNLLENFLEADGNNLSNLVCIKMGISTLILI